MGTMHVYGFAHRDLRAARTVIESALSICMEEATDSDESGYCFRWYAPPDGPCVQILSNYGASLRWGGDPRQDWHPDYPILVFVHAGARESTIERLRNGVPGLSFLEEKATM
jgi:hypothetical protein